MTSFEQIVIPPNRKRIISLTLSVAFFVAYGISIFIKAQNKDGGFFYMYHIGTYIGVQTILFFGLMLALWLTLLINKKPSLVINESGIIDRSTFVSAGKISWSDIECVKTTNIYSNKIITIMVREPQKVINAQKNILKKKLMAYNFKKYGSPVNIQTTTLLTTHEALKEIIEHKLFEHRNMR